MAILLEEKGIKFNWQAIIVIVLTLGFVGGITYILLSSPEIVQIVAPIEVKQTQELSRIKLDTATIKARADSMQLRSYIGPQTTGKLGRTNPFLKF